jgi:glycosyltransferase involved in cell wall biosynthesis
MMPLAHALARRGHFVRVVIPPWDDPTATRGEHATTTREGGVEVVTLSLPRRAPLSTGLAYRLVAESLRPSGDFRPEVAHVFKPVGYSGLAGLALWAMRFPFVLDTDDWEGPGGWADTNPYSPAQKAVAAVQDLLLPRLAGAVTAASRTLEARAWTFGLPRRRVLYMPNGVWREKYEDWLETPPERERNALRERLGLGQGPVLLLYTRFAEFPYEWPLEILAKVRESHPSARMLVVGEGFFGEEHRLLHEAAGRGLAGAVVAVGRVAEASLPLYLSQGDVALYPMRDDLINRAKSPVKVLEPMLAGLPVVAHGVGEAAELLRGAGMLVEPGDLDAMAEAASALLADPDRRRKMGEKARERVWSRYNWESLCLAAESAYDVALGRAASSTESVPGRL